MEPAGGILFTAAIGVLCVVFAAQAARLDDFGPPPEGDPSAQTGPFIGLIYADNLLRTLPPANEGAFILQGGVQGTLDNVGVNNVVPPPGQSNGSFNIPSNSKPSPLFGAQPFTQQMLVFEEFGPEPLNDNTPLAAAPFPPPLDNQSGPAPEALEAFLAQAGIGPFPSRVSNTVDLNPWKTAIESFLGRSLAAPPAEGRPPGEGWAHQRWNEFKPQAFFKTAQAGARTNGGFRDAKQSHGYSAGEFGPGGLYHTVYGTDDNAAILVGTTNGLAIRFHPNMPVQDPKALWTFDGTLPPKLLMARYGQPLLMRHYNALPIDPTANRGFGLHTITTHEHNGHSPAESDGYTNAFFFPGQFFDYRWPLQLAGYDTINTDASDPRAAFPCSPGETLFVNDSTDNTVTPKTCVNGSIKIRGDWHETMSTHWFHDHMLDFTAQNVYKGNAVMMNYYSALDRGKEDLDDGVNLRFPSGTALPWGNRDYDVNLVIADKAWDNTGQLWFNIFNTNGFLGDHLLTNWLYKPYFNVRARRYRFRILNGSVSRYFAIAMVRQRNDTNGEMPGPGGSGISYDRIPLHMIANDGNILEHAVPFDGSMDLYGTGGTAPFLDSKGQLPTQSIAERYDIIVDFGRNGIQPGDKLYFVNTLEHTDGHVVNAKIPLANILSENYKAELKDTNGDGVPDQWDKGDPAVGKFLEFRVVAHSGGDPSMNPDDYIPGRKAMIPLLVHHDNCADLAKLENSRHRSFEFGKSNGTDASPWTIKTDDGLLGILEPGFNMDPRRVSATPQLTTGPTQAGYNEEVAREVWEIKGGQGWDHPVHVHFEEGVILSRGGPPEDPATYVHRSGRTGHEQHRPAPVPPEQAQKDEGQERHRQRPQEPRQFRQPQPQHPHGFQGSKGFRVVASPETQKFDLAMSEVIPKSEGMAEQGLVISEHQGKGNSQERGHKQNGPQSGPNI
jgi:FtsP/CotA-like multicopper oxidase with cupredoxin domain